MSTRLYRMGYVITDTPGDLITCQFITTVTNGNYQTLQNSAGSSYQVTAGKTFVCGLMIIIPSVLNGGVELGYADAPVSNAAAPGANYKVILRNITAGAASTTAFLSIMFSVPATKYPTYLANGASPTINLLGVEV